MAKKYILIVVPISTVVAIIYIPEYTLNTYFIIISTFVNSLTIFYIIPKLTYILYTKPIYYESIELELRRTRRYILQNYFKAFIAISNSVFITAVVFYFFNGIYNEPKTLTKYNTIETIGILGGISSIFFKIQTYIGKCLLFFLFKIKDTYDLDTISLEMFPGYYEDVGMEPQPNILDNHTINQIRELLQKNGFNSSNLIQQ